MVLVTICKSLKSFFVHMLMVGTRKWQAFLNTDLFDLNNNHPSLLFFKTLISCSKVSEWINFLISHSRRPRFESVTE